MSSKITSEHQSRTAIVYVRQSTSFQIAHNVESQRRQYGLSTTHASWASAPWMLSMKIWAGPDPGWWSGPVSNASSARYAPVRSAPCSVSRHHVWPGTGETGMI